MTQHQRNGPSASRHDATGAKAICSKKLDSPNRVAGQCRRAPGSAYRPQGEALTRRQNAVLGELRQRGRRGLTRLEAGLALALSMPQRIAELRSMGYRIDSKRETAGDAWVARYRLVGEPKAGEALR